MSGRLDPQVLKGVSRSFYLSLRILPGPMRAAASLGYLLARASDTIADSAAVSTDLRLGILDRFAAVVAGQAEAPDFSGIIPSLPDPRERVLLGLVDAMLEDLRELPAAEAALVREVVGIIIGGQALDLARFRDGTAASPVALADDSALEDYTWRVAGCVGAFWTKLGLLTLGPGFSDAPADELIGRGVLYGQGLQLVNILRDLPADLAQGRCYLPAGDPADRVALLAAHQRWRSVAIERVTHGHWYGRQLAGARLRVASRLPAILADETLARLRDVSWEQLSARIRVPRSRVYLGIFRALIAPRD